MLIQSHGEKILNELGLTFSQARVYIALIRIGDKSTVKALVDYSKIARQDVYSVLAQLHKLSLVEMIIGNPTMFRAIPMQQVISILMERRNQKTLALSTVATELLKKFPEKKPRTNFKQETHEFVLIPKKEAVIRKIGKSIEDAHRSVLSITPWKELTQWLFMLEKSWNKALKRGITVRWITDKPQNGYSGLENITTILANPHFKHKFMPNSPKKRMGIFDCKEVYVATLGESDAADSPALWTDNSTMIHMLNDYFEMNWKLAEEYKIEKHQHLQNSVEKRAQSQNEIYTGASLSL